jgi:hypothetical protein
MTKDDTTMTARQYRRAVEELGISVYRSAQVLGVSLRQAQRFAAGETPVPRPVAKLLRLSLPARTDSTRLSCLAR